MFVSWFLFPLVLTALCLGCGLLLEKLSGQRLPGPLIAPAGFAVVLVATWIFTSRGETATLATPAVVLLAIAGAALTYPWGDRRLDRWALAAALGAYAVYAAPVVLSGNPTFAGYIKLDDTATWLAMTDRVMEHGREPRRPRALHLPATLDINLRPRTRSAPSCRSASAASSRARTPPGSSSRIWPCSRRCWRSPFMH